MLRCLLCLLACIPFSQLQLQAEDWPQHLGPQRNGISTETDLLDRWPADGPTEVWRVAGGVGMSGMAISRGQLLTMIQAEGKQRVISRNAKTGKLSWQADVAPEYRNGQGNGPRANPTIAGDTVFVFTGEGILTALNFADGKIIWSHDVVNEHGGKVSDYGMSCSPLVVGANVVVTVGAPKATFAAYDMKSGKLAWKAGAIDAAGYSSPALHKVGGREQIVASTGSSIVGLAPESGDVLWRYPYKTDYNCNIATPLAYEGNVFISSGENHGCVLLKLSPNGDDRFDVAEVWASQGTKSVLRNEWQTSILSDGSLYGFDNVGSAGPVTHLTCINAATGERLWQELRFGKGNLIAADGKLFMSTMKGELVIARLTPKGYQEIGRKTVCGTTRQAPALADGYLYLRDDTEIVCLDVRRK